MRVRENWERHGIFSTDIGNDLDAVTAAERQTLELLKESARRPTGAASASSTASAVPTGDHWDSPRTKRQEPRYFAPSAAALVVIARLLVNLLRMKAATVQAVALTRTDAAVGGITLVVAIFVTGWLGANDVGKLPVVAIVLVAGTLIVFIGRAGVVVVRAVRYRRAARLRHLSTHFGARHALEDLFDEERANLARRQRWAEQFAQPGLTRAVKAEATAVERLRRDVDDLSEQDLEWALAAEFATPVQVPAGRYPRAIAVAAAIWALASLTRMAERLTRLPLTPETAARVAAYNYQQRLDSVLGRLQHASQQRAGQAAEETR